MKRNLSFMLFPAMLGASDYFFNLEKSYEMINFKKANENHPQINGNGVKIGILDTYFYTSHPSLNGKEISVINNKKPELGDTNRQNKTRHGTHVAGIILGEKVAQKPYGIAPKAKYIGIGYMSEFGYNASIYDDLGDAKIINNSWASEVFPIVGYEFDNRTYKAMDTTDINHEKLAKINKDLAKANNQSDAVSDLIKLAKQKDALVIFASGNEGVQSPQSNAVARSYDNSIKSWIVVGSIAAQDTQMENGNLNFKSGKCSVNRGGRVINYDCESLSYFSNGFKGAVPYAIVAPGQRIDSANAYYNSNEFYKWEETSPHYQTYLDNIAEFYNMSGTSVATPMVSGAAVLLKQKFPNLKSSDLANIILSTANKNYTTPKMTINKSKGQNRIIYIDSDFPLENNAPNLAQIKQDLMANLNYTEQESEKILSNLVAIDPVISLKKEELFGQGVLDIDKALKGLATLDANRLDASDIVDFEGEKRAIYTLETKGGETEFANNLTQELWKDEYHLPNAINSPRNLIKDMQKIGFRKAGEGTLTLLGKNNDYKGITIVEKGSLKLKGELTNSDVWAINGAKFELDDGKLHQNFNSKNATLVLNGGEILQNANLEQNSKLEISKNSKIAGQINLNNSQILLNEKTLQTSKISLKNQAQISQSGTINGDVENISGVIKAGFESGNLDLKSLKINGKYTQNGGDLELGFTPDSQSHLLANSYEINGGNLIYVPLYDTDNSFTDGSEIELDLNSLPTSNLNIFVKDTNLFNFKLLSHNKIGINLKNNPFISPNNNAQNPNFGQNLTQILKALENPNLAQEKAQNYKEFFKALDKLNAKDFANTLDSLKETSLQNELDDKMILSQISLLDSANFAISQKTKPQSVDLNATHKNDEISFGFENTKFSHKSYTTRANSFHIKSKKELENSTLTGFAEISKYKTEQKYSRTKSDQISLGASVLFPLKNDFSLLLNSNLGANFNTKVRNIANFNGNINSNYTDYFVSFGGGIVKSFDINNFYLKPAFLLNHTTLFHKKFSENGVIFAKTFERQNHHLLTAALGLNLGQNLFINDEISLNLNGFGYYLQRLNGSKFSTNSRLNDFSQNFAQNTKFAKNLLYYGVDFGLDYERFFTKFGLSSQKSKDYKSLNANLNFGIRF